LNGKQAKKLRRAAKQFAEVMGQNGETIIDRGIALKKHRMKDRPGMESILAMGQGDEKAAEAAERLGNQVYATSVQNRPDSVRAIYRDIKKSAFGR
jgi:endo-alpha-1,4-polygalactosaminidase (GH114 family)